MTQPNEPRLIGEYGSADGIVRVYRRHGFVTLVWRSPNQEGTVHFKAERAAEIGNAFLRAAESTTFDEVPPADIASPAEVTA